MSTTSRAAIAILVAFLIVAGFVAWVTEDRGHPCPTGQVQVLMPGGYTCRPERTGGEVP
jgi:hypothetical protein